STPRLKVDTGVGLAARGVFHLDPLRSAGALGGHRERESCGPAPTGPAPGAPNPRWSPIEPNGTGVRVHGRSCGPDSFIEPTGHGVRAPALSEVSGPVRN